MDKKQIKDFLEQNKLDRVKIAFTDIDGISRGKILSRSKFLDNLDEGFGFCDVVFGWDSSDRVYEGGAETGWHTGFPDRPCFIDLSTLRCIPWQNNLPLFVADFSGSGTEMPPGCPRSLLKRVFRDCLELGLHPEFSQEFEWYNFQENPRSLHDKGFLNPQPITPGMFGYSNLRASLFNDYCTELFSLLNAFNIPVEALHTETGPGVYELALTHQDVLKAADHAALFKTSVKEIAYRHGIVASFMAKWRADLPGCGGHVHQSLWDLHREKNLFYDVDADDRMSAVMKHFIAGQIQCLPFILPMFAPTVNSYKRLVEGSWAPTRVNWGLDNRTTALRVVHNRSANARVETRVPGADANPYLAMAACLASGLYGIRHRFKADASRVAGNAYFSSVGAPLPANLFEATSAMATSPIAKELFGDAFVAHFTRTRFWEWEQFSRQVTDWELKRYFEII